jgi:bis(5'-nucleosidyl)-tetraphosphatase
MKDRSYGVIPFAKQDNGIKFLLIQQTQGHWSFPKGHPNNDENEIDAAKRELYEETGIKNILIVPNLRLEENYFFKKGKTTIYKTVVYFLGEVTDTKVDIQEEEVQDYRWVSYEEGINLITFKEAKKLLSQAYEFLV